MKVKELIEKLSKCPDDMIVVTDGYENGFDNLIDIEIIDVYERKNKSWWDGDYTKRDISTDKIKCVYIHSRSMTNI